jgi:hypothetical protein
VTLQADENSPLDRLIVFAAAPTVATYPYLLTFLLRRKFHRRSPVLLPRKSAGNSGSVFVSGWVRSAGHDAAPNRLIARIELDLRHKMRPQDAASSRAESVGNRAPDRTSFT